MMRSNQIGHLVRGLLLLAIRGALLWIVVPVAVVVWLGGAPWLLPRRVTLGVFLGWVDLNLLAFLERGLMRPLFRTRSPWSPVGEIAHTTHRIRFADPI